MGGARLQRQRVNHQFGFDVANNFTSRDRDDDRVFFDGETTVAWYVPKVRIGDRFEIGAEVPYVFHSGGVLDGLIDEFHDLLDTPTGNRESASRNQIDYLIDVGGVRYADFQSSQRGIGDVRITGAMQLINGTRQALAVRGQVKAPTGELEDLTGSGGWDATAWVEYAYYGLFGAEHLSFSLGVGGMALGSSDVVDSLQSDFAAVGHLGVQFALGRNVDMHVQLDTHSNLWDNRIRHASTSLQGTVGGRIRLAESLWLDLAALENLYTDASSDIVFQIAIGGRL